MTNIQVTDSKFTDITSPTHLEVKFSEDGRMWVNVDGICVLRICQITTFSLIIPPALIDPLTAENERLKAQEEANA